MESKKDRNQQSSPDARSPKEIEVVREVFGLYVVQRMAPPAIGKMLNERSIPYKGGRPWTRHIIRRMVTNPKYIGANVTNRLSAKSRVRRMKTPREIWVHSDCAFKAIIDPELFRKAQEEVNRTAIFRGSRETEHWCRCAGNLSRKSSVHSSALELQFGRTCGDTS